MDVGAIPDVVPVGAKPPSVDRCWRRRPDRSATSEKARSDEILKVHRTSKGCEVCRGDVCRRGPSHAGSGVPVRSGSRGGTPNSSRDSRASRGCGTMLARIRPSSGARPARRRARAIVTSGVAPVRLCSSERAPQTGLRTGLRKAAGTRHCMSSSWERLHGRQSDGGPSRGSGPGQDIKLPRWCSTHPCTAGKAEALNRLSGSADVWVSG